MTRAEEKASRIINAKRRILPHVILCVASDVLDRWVYSGQHHAGADYLVMDVSPDVMIKIMRRIEKIRKYHARVEMGLSWEGIAKGDAQKPDVSNALFKACEETETVWLRSIARHVPGISFTDMTRILTYLAYMATIEMLEMYGVKTQDAWYLKATFTTLANELIPYDSPLVLPLNKVFWDCRDRVMVSQPWSLTLDDATTPAEDMARANDTELGKQLHDWACGMENKS